MTADDLDRIPLPADLDTPEERRAAARTFAAALRDVARGWFVPGSARKALRRAADVIDALADAL